MKINDEIWKRLSSEAWATRENARILGDTKVGCSVYFDENGFASGCNIEHKFRCHDVHAEVNAISTMIAMGGRKLVAVLIIAEREKFTPCGGCLDWIFEFGGPDCLVAYQNSPGGKIHMFSAHDLMPHYPN